MSAILFRKTLRDLKANKARYLALVLMILFSIYIVVSLVGAAESTIRQTEESNARLHLEDGEFTTFTPLTEGEKAQIKSKGVTLEEIFSLDVEGEGKDILRAFRQREELDRITLKEGRLAERPGELVLERRYAEVHETALGDRISLGGKTFTVVGSGTVPDYNAPYRNLGDTAVDSKSFGLVFLCPEDYDALKDSGESLRTEEYAYAYRLESDYSSKDLKNYLKRISPNMARLEEDAPDVLEPEELYLIGKSGNLQMFLEAGDNIRIDAAADDVAINKMAGLIAGVLLMILFSYVISVFVINNIDRESTVIGALYSMGIRRRELIRHYILLPVVLAFLGGAAGLAFALTPAGIWYQMQNSFLYYSMPEMHAEVTPLLILYALVLPPVIAAVVNTLVIRKRLNRTPLALLRNEPRASRTRQIRLKDMSFLRMFRTRQMLREIRASLTVVFGLFLTLLMAMIAIYCQVYCDKVNDRMVEDTHYEYMYSYKFPTKEAPADGYPAIAENLSKSFGEYEFDVTLMGITPDNPFFDIDELPDSAQEVVLGSSFAYKHGLKEGDEFTLTDNDNDRLYGFRVAGITPYCPSHMVFMDIDALRELYQLPKDYYNVVFADKKLDISGERLFSTTARADVRRASGVFTDLMRPMIIVMSAASALIFLVVLFLMMKMMLDRSSFHISMLRVFGFRNREVRKMYLDGNFIVVALGALAAIPLTKLIMNGIFPKYLVANVSIAFEPAFPWYYYPVMYGLILMMYLLISLLLMRNIRKITPAEVLKNRE